jgi:hypothetical protein
LPATSTSISAGSVRLMRRMKTLYRRLIVALTESYVHCHPPKSVASFQCRQFRSHISNVCRPSTISAIHHDESYFFISKDLRSYRILSPTIPFATPCIRNIQLRTQSRQCTSISYYVRSSSYQIEPITSTRLLCRQYLALQELSYQLCYRGYWGSGVTSTYAY